MLFPFRKLFFNITFNFYLFLLLMIGIQNSTNKIKVNLISTETVRLPVSFIIGVSCIAGSVAGSFFQINFSNKKK